MKLNNPRWRWAMELLTVDAHSVAFALMSAGLFLIVHGQTVVFADSTADGMTPPTISVTATATTLHVTVDGTPPFTYAWFNTTKPIPSNVAAWRSTASRILNDKEVWFNDAKSFPMGSTDTLTITNPKQTGVFTCVVTNGAGSTISNSVRFATTAQADAADITITRKIVK